MKVKKLYRFRVLTSTGHFYVFAVGTNDLATWEKIKAEFQRCVVLMPSEEGEVYV